MNDFKPFSFKWLIDSATTPYLEPSALDLNNNLKGAIFTKYIQFG